jgi:hypothetical protein
MTPHRLAIACGLILGAFALGSGPLPSGDMSWDEAGVKMLVEAWEQAYQRRDTEWLGRGLDEDFVFTDASGRTSDKRQYLMVCAKSPDMSPLSAMGVEDVRVRLYGDVFAVVTSQGGLRGQGVSRDPKTLYRYTDVLVRRFPKGSPPSGIWKAVASQATRVAK